MTKLPDWLLPTPRMPGLGETRVRAVFEAAAQHNRSSLTMCQIANGVRSIFGNHLNKDSIKQDAYNMFADGKLQRAQRGIYSLA